MKALAKRPSTYADLKTLPEDVTGVISEIVTRIG